MQVKSIAECSKGSTLQYFWTSLSYHLLLRSLFCLFLSDRFTQGFTVYQMDHLNFIPDTAILANLDAIGLMWGSIIESKQTGQVNIMSFVRRNIGQ